MSLDKPTTKREQGVWEQREQREQWEQWQQGGAGGCGELFHRALALKYEQYYTGILHCH